MDIICRLKTTQPDCLAVFLTTGHEKGLRKQSADAWQQAFKAGDEFYNSTIWSSAEKYSVPLTEN